MYMGKGRKRGEKRLRAERQAYGDWQVFWRKDEEDRREAREGKGKEARPGL
jgi:hypothetical protein